jgi:pimeloyl-ACP methyl ester carboxylesterase
MGALLMPPPSSREQAIEQAAKVWRIIGSPEWFDEASVRARTARAFDRGFHPQGSARQLVAILTHGNRKPRLAGVAVPTLVIHGKADPLVPVEGGMDTADAIAGAELLLIEGMGHDLPRPAWPQMVDAISRLTARAA